jgi:hypothetical protein
MKSIERIFVTVILICLLVVGFVGSATAKKISETGEAIDKVENPSKNRFFITVDPRIELLAVVQHFTSWDQRGHIKSQTTYKDDIDKYFGKFKDHLAVTNADSLINAGFAYDAPVQLMLYHGYPPELAQKVPYSDYLIRRAGGDETLIKFADKLRDFARDSDFMRFYLDHSVLYDTLTSEVVSLFEGKDYVQALEDFYGKAMHRYNLVFSPLFSGNYGIPVIAGDEYDLFAVIGPCSLKGKRTSFACLDYLENMILHEWSHSFVNPLVDQNYELFEKSSVLFEPIKRLMQRQAYPNWRVTLYEHLVRACGEIHVRSEIYKDFIKEKSLKYHEGKGFWYISYIDSLLDIYQAHREQYPDFGQFLPVIASQLSQISVEDLPERLTVFRGPLDAVFTRTDCIHIVYPTAVDEESIDMLKKELEGFAGFLTSAHIEPVIVSDTEALQLDWQDKVAFIYGNARDNVFLAQLDIGIPLGFDENAIEFRGERYEGEGILFISCIPNPFNKKLPFCVCAANRPEDLVGVGSRINGPSEWYVDYILYRGDEKLDTGLYHKEKGKWSLVPEEK